MSDDISLACQLPSPPSLTSVIRNSIRHFVALKAWDRLCHGLVATPSPPNQDRERLKAEDSLKRKSVYL
ncbi:hypothetical protein [Absidia glauca]|uniref:Uncharacterized protein n=1 Tax=Absidia glauca TaxID=4829 RepID=A0A168QG83_ABSGL|nr:hypothetical protein [Absidia glauca]